MSLINQMLKDLDARHEGDVRAKLQREVRALPPADSGASIRKVIIALLGGAVLAGGWWAYERVSTGGGRVVSQDGGQPGTPGLVSAAAPVPAANDAPPASPLASTSPDEPASSTAVPSAAVDGMKLSPALDRLPQPSAPSPAPPVKSGKTPAAPAQAPAERKGVVEKSAPTKPARELAESEYRRAVGLVNGARVVEATDVLLDILRSDGGHVASRQLLARLLVEQRRFDEAMAILAEGLGAQPGQVGWAMQLARLQMERGDTAGAARTLKASQPYATGNADYQGFAGLVAHRQGRQKESAEHYQAAIRISPAEGRWWLGLGLAFEADGHPAEAKEAFLRARASGTLNADLAAVVDQKLR